MFLSLSVNNILKNIFMVERPKISEGVVNLKPSTATGSSFPSGHSQTASTLYTSIALYLKRFLQYLKQ